MTNVHLWTSNGLIGVKGHARRPIRSNAATHIPSPCPMIATHAPPSPVLWTGTIKTRSRQSSECMKSESWGQVHQSVKEGGGMRDGGVVVRGDWKERSKANGFVLTVIIRHPKIHFSSHRAGEMLGNGVSVPTCQYLFRCAHLFLYICSRV